MKIETAPTHPFAIEELACQITGLDYDEIDADTAIIEQKIIDQFDIDLGSFQEIIERLLPLIQIGQSELTKTMYKGFGKDGVWLVKMEIPKS